MFAVGRQELLAFLSLYAEAFHPPIDCSDLPTPLVIAMQDKTAAVRSLAESLLGVLNARALISKTALDKATRDLAPAAKRTLMPSVERMISLYGTRRAGGAVIPKGEDDESVGTASTAGTHSSHLLHTLSEEQKLFNITHTVRSHCFVLGMFPRGTVIYHVLTCDFSPSLL